MSQSSPPMADSRKRKETEPATSGGSPQLNRSKRRRTRLTLKKSNVEGWCSSLFETSSHEDEDSQSGATLSFSATTVSEKDEPSKNYQFYASKYGIRLKTVKKYYEILTTESRVSLVRAVPIKKELSPIPLDENISLSPILYSKWRLRKPRIKKENITPKKKNIKISKRASENITDYFKSLPGVKIKEEVLSCSESEIENFDSSEEFRVSTQRYRKNLKHLNSENEYKKIKKSKSTKKRFSETEFSFVTNPFSKSKSKDSYQNWSEMKRNKKTPSNDKISKKRKKITDLFENENCNGPLVDDSDKNEFSDSTIPKKIDTAEIPKKLNATLIKETNLTEVKSKAEIESVNSLAVNCHSLFRVSDINVKRTSTIASADCCKETLVSFGAGADHEVNDNISLDQPVPFAGNNVQSDKENGNALNSVASSNADDDSNNLNNNFVSFGICGSSIKLDNKSPIKKNQIRCSTPENKCVNDITKPKAKPKIISDTIIGKCLEKSVISSLNLGQKRLHLKTRPKSPITFNEPSKLEKQSSATKCMEDPPVPFEDNNGMMKTVQDSKLPLVSKSSALEDGLADKSLPAEKLSSGKPQGGKQQKHRLRTEALVEESFDSLCQDVCQLSNNENITLYKGEENEDDCAKNKKTTVPSKGRHLQNDTTTVNTPNTHDSTKILQMKFQSSNRLKFDLRKNIRSKQSSPVSLEEPLAKQQQQQLQQQQQQQFRQYQRQRQLQPQQRNEVNASNIPEDSSFFDVQNKNPRLNRSFSPNNIANVKDSRLNGSISALDSRLNKSCSPTKAPVIKDPRLLRGNSQPRTSIPPMNLIQSPEKDDSSRETIVDPRLRKRKEREEAEQAAKMVKEEIDEGNDSGVFVYPQSCHTPRRSAVFNRLGTKSDSPEKEVKPEKDVIQNIVKAARSISPTKSTTSDNDDDISLFAADTFSSDEESNSSPRHRKFTSERLRMNEEIRNQPISLKDRIGWNNSAATHRKPTMPTPVFTPVNRPPITTRGLVNPIRSLHTSIQPVHTPMPQVRQIAANTTFATAKDSSKITFNEFGNNDSEFNDNFLKMNAAQMQKDVANLRSQHDFESNAYITFDSNNATQYDQKSMLDGPHPLSITSVAEQNKVKHFFTKYCFKMLKTGKCVMNEAERCHFVHQIQVLKCLLQKKTEKEIIQILEYAFNVNFDYFISYIWETILPILQDSAFSIFQKLYNKEVVLIDKFLLKLLDYCINSKLHSVESFVKRISPIVRIGDSSMVRSICVAIKGKLTDGFCWEAIKDLCQKAVPPRDMIELTLIQCLKRKKNKTHIMEVNDLITKKMTPAEREVLSTEMLMKFNALVRSLNPPPLDKDLSNTVPLKTIPVTNANRDRRTLLWDSASTLRSESIDSAQSLEQEKPLLAPPTSGTSAAKVNRKVSPISISPSGSDAPFVVQPHDSPLQPGASTPKKGEIFNFSEYFLKELEAEEPKSVYRDRFWKLYVTLHSVREGLGHLDYEYVWKVMDEFSKQEGPEVLKNAYYHLLCKHVRSSEKHMSEIIKQAVRARWSTSRQSLDVLFDVGISALINLANNDLWVLALQLLSWVKILEPEEPKTVFVLISAEIYLANNDPLEALYLLQKTRLIRTNRDEWMVKDSTEFDEKHRNKIVFILLKALSFTDPEKASYLFKALMEDQYCCYYPIDLPLYLDKLTLLLLIYKKEELVSEVCRIVMDNDLTFQKETYQELLRYMLGYDEVLANQLLDYAIHLGYYSDIQIRDGYTTVIIDMNLCEEELYLIFKRLIQKLTFSIGPALYRMKQGKLKVFLMFEDVPNDKRLYRNDCPLVNFNKYRAIKNVVSSMLATRFSPPIKMACSKRVQKCCKIVSRTLVNYLKHWT